MYSNTQKKIRQQGQVLLLLIMVMATLVIVAMTAIFQSTTQVQITGATQNSQRALSAAESALEAALLNPSSVAAPTSFADLGLTALTGIDLENSTVRMEERRDSDFTIQKIDADNQYTFYLSEYTYDSGTSQVTWGFPFGGRFRIMYTSENETIEDICQDVSLEFILVYDVVPADEQVQVKTFVADAGDLIDADASDPNNLTDDDIFYQSYPEDGEFDPPAVEGQSYECETHALDTRDYPNPRVLIIRPYFSSTKIALQTEIPVGGSSYPLFPPQGRTFTAVARTSAAATPTTEPGQTTQPAGVTRTAVLFQSYPQLTAEMFTTSF